MCRQVVPRSLPHTVRDVPEHNASTSGSCRRMSNCQAVHRNGAAPDSRLAMERYDPEIAPVAEDWLDLDEGERPLLVEAYHRDARISMPKGARKLHASMHVVVENQLAENDEPVVRALARLMKEGLTRHDAVHAIGSLVAEQIYDLLKQNDTPETSRARYYAAVERLTAQSWRESSDD